MKTRNWPCFPGTNWLRLFPSTFASAWGILLCFVLLGGPAAAPAAPPVLTLLSHDESTITIQASNLPAGGTYRVESATKIMLADWAEIRGPRPVPANGVDTFTLPMAGKHHLIRVQAQGQERSLAYGLLEEASDVITLDGSYTSKYEADGAQGRGFDARNATFVTGEIKWGAVDIEAGSSITDMVWAGGYFDSGKPWDASWDDHKATSEADLPGRNSVAIENRSTRTTITGVYAHNVHDGFRSSTATDWVVQHCWASYVRDDAIENDKYQPGFVFDCIFDGTYSGISARPSSSNEGLDAEGAVLRLEKVLVRMQAMPYPYKWEEKPQNVVDSNNRPWEGGVSQGIPYGHGNIFKIVSDGDPKNMHWSIKDCTIVGMTNMENKSYYDFPDDSLIDELENVTIVWLGDGTYPGYLPTSKFPGQFTVLYGTEGLNHYWSVIEDWHLRHPDVEPTRKPDPGTTNTPLVFPETF